MNQVINHPQFGQIEVEKIKNEPWFVAKDVCSVLEIQNVTQAVNVLDEDEKLTYTLHRAGQTRVMNLVNESGLYALIMRSNKPMAKQFRKWVTAEVLPSIRKYGTYSTDAKIMERAIKRTEAKVVTQLFREIDYRTSETDKRLVAKQCLTDEHEVNKVLRQKKEDVHMMKLLFARAAGNKQYRADFYELAGAENLLNHLRNENNDH